MSSEGRYYGKYRGVVLNNVDPMQMGRVQVQVPDVMGVGLSSWAMACVPFTGKQSGVYCVPQIGAGVWVEFEQGDINYPVWVGCRWGGPTDIPTDANAGLPASPSIVMQTLAQHAFVISDMPPTPVTGGIMLKTLLGAMVVVNDSGIYITNGMGATISLVGPTVTINNGALVVT